MKKRIKNIVKQVFLTEEEHARLLALMTKEKEDNFSSFARRRLLYRDIKSWIVRFPEYVQMADQLILIGRSINTIAKSSTQAQNISKENLVELGQLMNHLVEVVEKELLVRAKGRR